MLKISVDCDRCGKTVEGGYVTNDDGLVVGTSGYYEVEGGIWSQYADEGEEFICDECMHSDPRYVAVYGPDTSELSLPVD